METKTLREDWAEVLPLLKGSVPFEVNDAAVCVFRVGSHSHGTHVAPVAGGIDDTDLMVLVIPPIEFRLGLQQFEHSTYKQGKWDVVIYDWGKFLRLVVKSNPNVLGCLFLAEEDCLVRTLFPAWSALMEGRDRLLSKRMYASFMGYAAGQRYKMEHTAAQGYMGEKRKRLVEQFGYDCKNAAHLTRLMRMCVETLETGTLNVRRADAAELVDIKKGRWSKERVFEEADRLLERAESSLAATTLPDAPDEALIERVMIEGYKQHWGWRTTW